MYNIKCDEYLSNIYSEPKFDSFVIGFMDIGERDHVIKIENGFLYLENKKGWIHYIGVSREY